MAMGSVPDPYLDEWARLQCRWPAALTEARWRQAVDDCGRFFDAWGSRAAEPVGGKRHLRSSTMTAEFELLHLPADTTPKRVLATLASGLSGLIVLREPADVDLQA